MHGPKELFLRITYFFHKKCEGYKNEAEVLLRCCLFFGQIWACVAYKSVAYKKKSVYNAENNTVDHSIVKYFEKFGEDFTILLKSFLEEIPSQNVWSWSSQSQDENSNPCS